MKNARCSKAWFTSGKAWSFMAASTLLRLKWAARNPWFTTLLLLVAMLGGIGWGPTPPDAASLYLETVGRWPLTPRGNVISVHAAGNHAFLGLNVFGPGGCAISSRGWAGRVEVLDIRDPARPVRVGGFRLEGKPIAMGSAGHFLYVVDGHSLRCYDIQNPAAPVPAGVIMLSAEVQSMVIDGSHAYLGFGMPTTLLVLDISNPAQMVKAGEVNPEGYNGSTGVISNLQIIGNHLYSNRGNGELIVFDISNPAKPTIVGRHELQDGSYNRLFLAGDYAFFKSDLGLDVLDIRNPSAPQVIRHWSSLFWTGDFIDFNALNGKLCLHTDPLSAYFWNRFYPQTRATLTDLNLTEEQRQTTLVYLLNSILCGVSIWDAALFANVTLSADTLALISQKPEGSDRIRLNRLLLEDAYPLEIAKRHEYPVKTSIGMAGIGSCLYLASSNQFHVLDVSDPLDHKLTTTVALGGFVEYFQIAGGLAYVFTREIGLSILDLADPAHPIPVGVQEMAGTSEGIQIEGQYAYLADGYAGLQILDISDPTQPRRVGQCPTAVYARAVALAGSHACVVGGGWEGENNNALFLMADISNPAKPKRVGTLALPGEPRGLRVANQTAFVAAGTNLFLVDISRPDSPQITASISKGVEYFNTMGVEVFGGNAYVVASDQLVVVSITNALMPQIVSAWTNNTVPGATYLQAQGLQVRDSHAYVLLASETSDTDIYRSNGAGTPPGRLLVFDISNPAQLQLVGECRVSGRARSIEIHGRYAYVAGGAWDEKRQAWRDGLDIIDVRNPLQPLHVGAFDIGGWSRDVNVREEYAYLAAGDQGLVIVRLPPAPTAILEQPMSQRTIVNSSVDLEVGAYPAVAESYQWYQGAGGDTAHPIAGATAATYSTPQLDRTTDFWVRITTPGGSIDSRTATIHVLSRIALEPMGFWINPILGWRHQRVAVQGNSAYLTCVDSRSRGLLIGINVSDPLQPYFEGSLELGLGNFGDIEFAGHYAYATTGSGLKIIDVSHPAPVLIRTWNDAWLFSSSTTANNVAYAISIYTDEIEGNTLQVLNLSDPTNPVRTGRIPLCGFEFNLKALGSHVYAIINNVNRHDFNVFDASNPAQPRWAGNCPVEAGGDIQAVGSLAFITGNSGPSTVNIIDVSNPVQPVKIGGIQMKSGWHTSSCVAGTFVFVSVVNENDSGLQVYDVANPAQPVCVGNWNTKIRPMQVQVVDNRVYIADESQGLIILKATPMLQLNPPVVSGETLTLSWPEFPGIRLQQTPALVQPNWQDVPGSDSQSRLDLPLQKRSGYFRLIKP